MAKKRTAKKEKKWKGKDWYVILAPKLFDEMALAEVPATDPKQLKDRRITIGLSELDRSYKLYLNLIFRVVKMEGKNAYTRFDGCFTPREFLYRMVRKRAEKVETVDYVKTKDDWNLKVKMLTILNRSCPSEIQTKVRSRVSEILKEEASKNLMDDFLKHLFFKRIQNRIKKDLSSIYPARFSEAAKIVVLKVPEPKASKPSK
jgi:small subunit ribosomal protein S3Ae